MIDATDFNTRVGLIDELVHVYEGITEDTDAGTIIEDELRANPDRTDSEIAIAVAMRIMQP